MTDDHTQEATCDYCGTTVELYGVVDLYDDPDDVPALCSDCCPGTEADA